MEAIKNTVKQVTGSESESSSGAKLESQFEQGHRIPVTDQGDAPGHQHKLPINPVNSELPNDEGGYQKYKAAGKLQGKKVIITGGDSGIGRAIAVLFAMEGAESVLSYLPEEEKDAQDAKKEVQAAGGVCHLFPKDISSVEACQALVDFAYQQMGGVVNILCNNAAYQMTQKDISDLSYDQWHKTFNTNIHPYFYLSKILVPKMKRGDTIINNASINAYTGHPNLLDYTSTKGAIISFTRGLANQQIQKGIRVNAVCPGPVWTPLIPATMDAEAQEKFTTPMGRPAQPSEIATCFVFLASADSSMLTGQSLHPNGGSFTTS